MKTATAKSIQSAKSELLVTLAQSPKLDPHPDGSRVHRIAEGLLWLTMVNRRLEAQERVG